MGNFNAGSINWGFGIDLTDLTRDLGQIAKGLGGLKGEFAAVAQAADTGFAAVVAEIKGLGTALKPVSTEFATLGREINSAMKSIERDVDKVNKAVRQTDMTKWEKAADNYAQSIKKASSSVEQLKQKLDAANVSDKQRADLKVKIAAGEAHILELTKQSKVHVDQLRQAEEKRLAAVKANTTELSGALRDLSLTAGLVGGALTAGFMTAEKKLMDLSDQTAAFRAVSGATNAEVSALVDTAKGLEGIKTTSAVQAAVALSRAGLEAKEATQWLGKFSDASLVAGESMEEVSTLILGTNRAFGLQNTELGRTTDIVVMTANATATSVTEVGHAMSIMGSTAKSTNQTVLSSAKVFGVLRDANVSAEMAATGYKNALQNMNSPMKQASEAMDKLFKTTDAANKVFTENGKMRDFSAIMKDIKAQLIGMNDVQKIRALDKIFEERDLNIVMAYLNQTEEKIESTGAKIDKFNGITESSTAIMKDSFGHQVRKLQKDFDNLQMEIAEDVLPVLMALMSGVKETIKVIQGLPDPLKQTAAQAALAGIALAGVVTVLGGGSWAVLNMISLFGKLEAALLAAGLEASALKVTLGGLLGATGVGALIGGGINLGMNAIADRLNKRSDEIDAGIASDQKTKGGLATAMNQGDKKINPEQTRKAALEALANITRLKKEIVDTDRQLAELEVHSERAKRYGIESAIKENQRQKDALEAKKKNLSVEITQQEQLKKKYQDLLQVKQEDVRVEQASADAKKKSLMAQTDALEAAEKAAEARKEADKAQQEQNKAQFRTWDEADKAFEASLKGRLTATTEASDKMDQTSSEFSNKLLASAKRATDVLGNTTGACLAGVNTAFEYATGKVLMYTRHAYQALSALQKDARFTETKWDQKSTLPMGAVVVWDKGSSKSGHISVADGKGGEYSDHYAKQMQKHYGGGAPHVFVPKGMHGQMGAASTSGNVAEQSKLNEQIAYYNKQLGIAVKLRGDIEKEGLKDTESWNDANTKVSEYQNKIQTLTGQVGDAMAKTAKELHELQEKNLADIEKQIDAVARSLESKTTGLMQSLAEKNMNAFQKQSSAFGRDIEEAVGQVIDLNMQLSTLNLTDNQRTEATAKVKGLNAEILALMKAQKDTLADMSIDEMLESVQAETDFVNSLRNGESAMKAFVIEAQKSGDVTDSLIDKIKAWAKANNFSSAATDDLVESVKEYTQSLKDAAEAQEALSKPSKKTKNALGDNQINTDVLTQGIGAAINMFGELGREIGRVNETAGRAVGQVTEYVGTMFDSIAKIVKGIATGDIGSVINGAFQALTYNFHMLMDMIVGGQELIRRIAEDAARLGRAQKEGQIIDLDNQINSAKRSGQPTVGLEVQRANLKKNMAIQDRVGAFNQQFKGAALSYNEETGLDIAGQVDNDKIGAVKIAYQELANEIKRITGQTEDEIGQLASAMSDGILSTLQDVQNKVDEAAQAARAEQDSIDAYRRKQSGKDGQKSAVESMLDTMAGNNPEMREALRKTAEDINNQQLAIVTEVNAAFGERLIEAQLEKANRFAQLAVDSESVINKAIAEAQKKMQADREKAWDDAEKVRDADLKKAEDKLKQDAERLKKKRVEIYNIDVKIVQDLIAGEQKKLDLIDKQNKGYQKQLKDKEALHKQDMKDFDANDKGIFAGLVVGQDIAGEIRAGLGDIANPEGTPTGTFSAQSIQEAMKARVELMTLQNENKYKLEEISQEEYLKQQQKIAAIQAGFANEALKADGLTNRQRLELEQSKADAYVQFQNAYRQALQSRFDAELVGTQQSIDANNAEAEVIKGNMTEYQDRLGTLKTVMDEYSASVDARVAGMIEKNDEWIGSIESVVSAYQTLKDGIGAAFDSATKNASPPSSSFSSSGGSGMVTSASGYTYNPSSFSAETRAAFGLASGGIVPPGYPNDTYPAFLTSGEAVLPTWLVNRMQSSSNVNNNQRIAHIQIVIQGDVTDKNMIESAVTNALNKADYSATSINGAYYAGLN